MPEPILRAPEPGEFPQSWRQELGGHARMLRDFVFRPETPAGQTGDKLRDILGIASLFGIPVRSGVRTGEAWGTPKLTAQPFTPAPKPQRLEREGLNIIAEAAKRGNPMARSLLDAAVERITASVARRFGRSETRTTEPVVSQTELQQAGREAFLKAFATYDPTKGDFLQDVYPAIMRDVGRYSLGLKKSASIGEYTALERKVWNLSEAYEKRFGYKPSDSYIAGRLNLKPEDIKRIRSGKETTEVSLATKGGKRALKGMPSSTDPLSALILRQELDQALAKLPEKARQAITLSQQGVEPAQAAKDMKMTPEGYKRFVTATLEQLRQSLGGATPKPAEKKAPGTSFVSLFAKQGTEYKGTTADVHGDTVYWWHDPQTGTTGAIKDADLKAGGLAKMIAESRAKFNKPPEPPPAKPIGGGSEFGASPIRDIMRGPEIRPADVPPHLRELGVESGVLMDPSRSLARRIQSGELISSRPPVTSRNLSGAEPFTIDPVHFWDYLSGMGGGGHGDLPEGPWMTSPASRQGLYEQLEKVLKGETRQ